MSRKRQTNFFTVCSRCKTSYSCCHGTRPPISNERKEIVEAYLKKEKIPVTAAFAREEYVFPRENVEGYCIFHDVKTRKCQIHAVKPETCVAGPITFDINLKTAKIEWFVKMDKICPLAGVVYADKELLRKHLESAKREVLRLVNELDGIALKNVLGKDEPETSKIDENNIGKDVLDKLTQ